MSRGAGRGPSVSGCRPSATTRRCWSSSCRPTRPARCTSATHARPRSATAICNLLRRPRLARSLREFYYNDAGVQIANARECRCRSATAAASSRATPQWPESGLQRRVHRRHRRRLLLPARPCKADDRSVHRQSGDVNDLDGITPVRRGLPAPRTRPRPAGLRRALRPLLPRKRACIRAAGSTTPCKRLIAVDQDLIEEGGALWLRTTEYGDDKDRVMRKSAPAGADSSSTDAAVYTYFVPDVAYHLQQARTRLHQGHQHPGRRPPRHRGAGAGRRAGRGHGRAGRLSGIRAAQDGHRDEGAAKRSRSPSALAATVTLRDLIDWTSRDAVRFFLHEPQGRHRVHLRRRPGAEGRTTRTRCSTCSTRTRASAR